MDSATAPNTHIAGDVALVGRARGGDREAFTAIVDARLATTYRTAQAFLSNEADARDATEEVFLRTWRDLPELRDLAGFGVWFDRIVDDTCRRAALDRRRGTVRDTSPGPGGAPTTTTLRGQILDRVAATPQRSGVKTVKSERDLDQPPSRRARVAGLLVIAVLGVALVLIVRQRLQAPETPLRSGLVAFVRDGDVYIANPDGSAPALVVHQDGLALSTVVWSPDARRIAIDGDSGAILYDTATGATTLVGGTSPAWSPDGRRLAVLDNQTETARVRIRDVETGTTTDHPMDAAGDLAWSPDGRWIAAIGGDRDRYRGSTILYRLNVETGEVLTADPDTRIRGPIRRPVWSPDSSRIAFSRGGSNGYSCGDSMLCDSDVFTSDSDGTGIVQLNEPKLSADRPAWSPDGQWIAFRQGPHIPNESVQDAVDDPDADIGLVIVSPDLTATRTLAVKGVRSFDWSPEGDRLRYVRTAGKGLPPSLWEVSIEDETRGPKALGLSIDPATPYAWRRDAGVAWQSLARAAQMPAVADATPRPSVAQAVATPAPAPPADPSASWPKLAVDTSDGCSPPILVLTSDGSSTPVDIPCDGNSANQYGWSPTGTRYARLSVDGRLTTFDLDGTEQANIGDLVGVEGFSWSPAGSWLSLYGPTARIIRPDGTGLRELPGSPSWSPDDRRLSIGLPDGSVLLGQGDGSGLKSIGTFPGVVLSTDPSRFAFIRDGDVWTAAADGTDVRNVTSFPLGGASNAVWSSDGSWLAVSTQHGAWLMRPDGSDRRGLTFGPSTSISNLAWAPDTSRFAVETYSETAPNQHISIYLLNVDGSPTIRVDDATGPSWSPDGRYLAVNHVKVMTDGGYEVGDIELLNADGSGRHELTANPNGNSPIWVRPGG